MIDIGSPRYGPLALPGTYTVRLLTGGRTYTQELEVTADPRVELDLPAVTEHLSFQLEIRDQMSEIARMVETIRSVRDQIQARARLLADNPDAVDLLEKGHDLVAQLDAIEETLHNPRAEVSYDILAGRHGGAQLYSRLSWLFEATRDHERVPTQGMREVGAEMAAELAEQRSALEEILTGGLEGLETLTREKGLAAIISR